MLLKQRSECPLCGSSSFSEKMKNSFDPHRIDARNFKITDSSYGSCWHFYRCHQCQFVFSSPYIPEEQILELYSHLEDREYSDEREGRGKNFKKILKILRRQKLPGKKLLDIGAASGIFLNLARQEGYEVTGLEPSKHLVEEAHRLYDLKLIEGTIDKLPAPAEYDVVMLLDIIEHLVEPDTFFARIAEITSPGGMLVIVTPDISSLTARLLKSRWWHYRIAHLNFFNLPSLRYILHKHGFKIEKKRRYAWNFSLFYLISRKLPSLKKSSTPLQKILKRINLRLQLFDSWEIYARKN